MILTFTNRKGGTGKTVSCFMMGSELNRRGYKVLFVDLDSQANLSFDLAAPATKCSAFDLLTGSATAPDAIMHTSEGDLIPSAPELSAADLLITGSRKEYRLKDALEGIQAYYDYILIDTAPQLNTLTTNALTAADAALICAQAEIHSIQGIAQLYDSITTVKKKSNPDLMISGILITRYNSRSNLAKAMRENLQDAADQMHTRLYNTAIRECTAIREAEAMQKDIFTYNKRSNGAADYAAFVDEFLNEKGR